MSEQVHENQPNLQTSSLQILRPFGMCSSGNPSPVECLESIITDLKTVRGMTGTRPENRVVAYRLFHVTEKLRHRQLAATNTGPSSNISHPTNLSTRPGVPIPNGPPSPFQTALTV